jgi:glycosyltransferase involved in cell wall biosynthesis
MTSTKGKVGMGDEKARLAVLSSEFPPKWGGVGNGVFFLVRSLAEEFHYRMDVVTRDMGPRMREERPPLPEGIDVHEVPFTKLPMYFATSFGRNAVDWMTKGGMDWDLCHVHSNMTLLSEKAYHTIKERMPIVSTMHGTWMGERSEMEMGDVSMSVQGVNDLAVMYISSRFDRYEDYAIELSDVIVAESRREEEALRTRASREAAKRMVRIPPGVDTERFSPRWEDPGLRKRLGIKKGELHILHVGRLAGRKGLDTLIEAFERIVSEVKDAKLVVVGTGPREKMLRKEARVRGFEDRMVMVGSVPMDELAAHFATADITLFPSKWEGFGLITLETMASGTPCVATSVGAADEIIEDGKSGFLVDVGDAKAIAKAVARFARDEETMAHMGERARERVMSTFTWKHTAERYDILFRRLLEERK